MGRTPKTRRNRYGAWLFLLRKESKLSQQEVARRTGIPRTNLMYWERTGNLIGRKQILKLAQLYDVSIEKLLRPEKFRQE
ncbi:MAG TPA: helix-turn-helix transcriptional regulator [Verrucomicrobiae bacterium]|nr:helix-turn-helix transcriptional regulator [Verrucomicrobiae bacterium]